MEKVITLALKLILPVPDEFSFAAHTSVITPFNVEVCFSSKFKFLYFN